MDRPFKENGKKLTEEVTVGGVNMCLEEQMHVNLFNIWSKCISNQLSRWFGQSDVNKFSDLAFF